MSHHECERVLNTVIQNSRCVMHISNTIHYQIPPIPNSRWVITNVTESSTPSSTSLDVSCTYQILFTTNSRWVITKTSLISEPLTPSSKTLDVLCIHQIPLSTNSRWVITKNSYIYTHRYIQHTLMPTRRFTDFHDIQHTLMGKTHIYARLDIYNTP